MGSCATHPDAQRRVSRVRVPGQVATGAIGTDAFQEADVMGISRPARRHASPAPRARWLAGEQHWEYTLLYPESTLGCP